MMASETKTRSCFPGEPISTSCAACGGLNETKEDKSKTDETFAGFDDGPGSIRNNIPVDRGWAWVVCAGCFVITYTMSLYDQVLAVMFVDVRARFDVPVSTATVVFTIHAVTFSVGSVISTNIIVPKCGVRVVIVTAAIANSLSTIIIAFSPNFTFYLIFHLLKGFSIGSLWIPSLGLLGYYFKRCRSVATSITNAGISVSLLVTPLFVRELLDNLGFLGTLLIISGVELQAVAVCMLLRPPSRYIQKHRQPSSDQRCFQINGDDKERYSLLDSRHAEVGFKANDIDLSERQCTCGLKELNRKQVNQQGINTLDLQCKDERTSQDEPLVRPEENVAFTDVTVSKQTANISTIYIDVNSQTEQQSLPSDSHAHASSSLVLRQLQNTQVQPTPLPDTTMNEIQDQMKSHPSDKNERYPCVVLRSLFDFKLLSDWLMRLLLASTLLGALLQYIPTYIPTLAVQKGVDKTEAAILLTVCGGVNLVSTLLQGFVIDSKVITAARFVAICQLIVGTMCHLTHILTSFPTLLLLSVTHGMFGGARMSLMPVVAMDFVGVDNLSKALGFNAMIATLSLSLHHPFLGYLLEKTSSFEVPFHYVGFALYISACLLLLEPCGRKLNSRGGTHREHGH